MNIKAILASILGLITGLLGIFFAGRKAGKDAMKAKQAAKSVEAQSKATKAIIEGHKRETEIRATPVDATRRDHFE